MTHQVVRKRETEGFLPLNLPVYYECLAISCEWRRKPIDAEQQGTTLLSLPDPADTLEALGGKTGEVSRFDPREKRTEFLRLREGDTDSLQPF